MRMMFTKLYLLLLYITPLLCCVQVSYSYVLNSAPIELFRSGSVPVFLQFRSDSAPVLLRSRSLYKERFLRTIYFPKLRSVDVNDYNGVVFGCHWKPEWRRVTANHTVVVQFQRYRVNITSFNTSFHNISHSLT